MLIEIVKLLELVEMNIHAKNKFDRIPLIYERIDFVREKKSVEVSNHIFSLKIDFLRYQMESNQIDFQHDYSS